MNLRMVFVALMLLTVYPAHAAMVTRPVEYTIDTTVFEGQLIYDDAIKTPRPGLVMVPNWYGVNAKAIEKAQQIAGQTYVIFLADMYGKSIRPNNDEEAMAAVKPLYTDRLVMRKRVNAALDQLKAQVPSVAIDLKHLAAIGFCFGGSAVLDLARSGADIAAIVTFHGNLSTDNPALAKNIKARVLVLNGADDSSTANQVTSFEEEMRAGGVDWQFVNYGGAVHCFTERGEDKPGCKYDAKVARRAMSLMRAWLDEAFAN